MRVAFLLIALTFMPAMAGAASAQPEGARSTSKPAYLGLDFRWQYVGTTDKFLHVERVASRGPADLAGLRPGDIITHFGGVRVGFGDDLDFLNYLRERKPGDRLVTSIIRAGRPVKAVIVLGALPDAARSAWESGYRVAQERRAQARASRAQTARDPRPK